MLTALGLSWAVMLALMWAAFWRLPSPELLQRQRLVQPPTLASLAWEALLSALERAAFVALLWPRWARFYAARLAAAVLGGALWFVLTTPLAISSIERVHRRWLALVVLALALLLAGRLLRAGRARRRPA